MKSFLCITALAVLVAGPVTSFAQSETGKTRAEVRAELVQLEAAGYNPRLGDPYYPRDIQAAEMKVMETQVADVGDTAEGSTQAGRAADYPPAPGKTQRNPLGTTSATN